MRIVREKISNMIKPSIPRVFAASLLLLNLSAQSRADIGMEEILFGDIPLVVSASKKSERLDVAPSNISVITEKQIKEWGVRHLRDVLERVPGYYVVADRDEWVFSSRGIVSDNNAKFLMLIDGQRINSTENFGPGQIIELPMDLSNVKQIEIIRGPGSAVWGADALAGVINIITKDPKDMGEDRVRTSVSAGSHGSYTGNFQVGKDKGDSGAIFMGAMNRSDGRMVRQWASTNRPVTDVTYNFNNEFGARTHPFGEYNTLLDQQDPGLMLQLKMYSGDFSLNSLYDYTQFNNRHEESGLAKEAVRRGEKFFQEGKWHQLFDNELDLTVKGAVFYTRTEDFAKTGTLGNISWLDRGVRSQVEFSKPLSTWLGLNGGLDYQLTVLGTSYVLPSLNFDVPLSTSAGRLFDEAKNDTVMGSYALFNITPVDKVNFSIGTRYDYGYGRGTDHHVLSPRASVVWKAADATVLKAMYNRGFKKPENSQTLNPVKSEIVDQGDLQWIQTIGKSHLTTTLYWQKVTGLINILSGQTGGNANSGTVEAKGAEMEYTLQFAKRNNLWANASYTQAEGKDAPADLPFNNRRYKSDGTALSIPPYTANLGVTVYVMDNLFLSPAVRHVSRVPYRIFPPSVTVPMSLDTAVESKTPAFTYLDINIGYEPSKTVGLAFYAHNLLDEKDPTHLSIWNGTIGQYGRYIEGTVSLKF